MKNLLGEIQYENSDGVNVHSDITAPKCVECGDRAHLHALLDEWLSKGCQTGWFVLGLNALMADVKADPSYWGIEP